MRRTSAHDDTSQVEGLNSSKAQHACHNKVLHRRPDQPRPVAFEMGLLGRAWALVLPAAIAAGLYQGDRAAQLSILKHQAGRSRAFMHLCRARRAAAAATSSLEGGRHRAEPPPPALGTGGALCSEHRTAQRPASV